jgi:dimethylamine monooxygenase subunit C
MLVSGIKSRPKYATLEPDPFAKFNLVLADGEGVHAVARLLERADGQFRSRTVILCVATGQTSGRLPDLQVERTHLLPTTETLLLRFDSFLATATMGIRLYVAGTEGLIGLVIQHAESFGIDHKSVVTEHCGSLARRIQCVHCKGITGNVTTNIARCDHCGIDLLVRDHYSRRYAAFMAVSVDAEAPGNVPTIEEVFR